MSALIGVLAAVAVLFPAVIQAAEPGEYLQFSPQTGVNAMWIVVGVVAVVAVIVLAQLYNRFSAERHKAPSKAPARRSKTDFKKQAARLGFKIAEIKTLRLLARKLMPQDPDALLNTDAGRERLATDVWERIRKREREIALLKGIQEKLKLMRDDQLQERAMVRVETDLAVWIIKKSDIDDEEEGEEGEEELFTDVEQVSGKLRDLSEGGAAVVAELEVRVNDLIELWSADSDIWIPPVTAGVLQVERQGGDRAPVLHLHFLDPPLHELRVAIQAIQRGAGHRAV